MFPPFSSRRYDFSEARALTTGCNHTDKSNRLIYEIYLSSGEHFDLGSLSPSRATRSGRSRRSTPLLTENRTQAVVTFGARSGPSNLPHRLGSTVRPAWRGSPCQAVAPTADEVRDGFFLLAWGWRGTEAAVRVVVRSGPTINEQGRRPGGGVHRLPFRRK